MRALNSNFNELITHQNKSEYKSMKSLITLLEKVDLANNPKTIEMMDRAINNAFNDAADKEECEILVAIAYKYNLPCFDDLHNRLDLVQEHPLSNLNNS